jgi:hypothetical protein
VEAVDSDLSVLDGAQPGFTCIRRGVAEGLAPRVDSVQLIELTTRCIKVSGSAWIDALDQRPAYPPQGTEPVPLQLLLGGVAQRLIEKMRGGPDQGLQLELQVVAPAEGKRVDEEVLVAARSDRLEHDLGGTLESKGTDDGIASCPIQAGDRLPVITGPK